MTEFNNMYNYMIDMTKNEIQCINLYKFSKNKNTRRLMIFILEPFVNLINNNNLSIFYNTLVNIENININIEYDIIVLLVEQSVKNIEIERLIGLLIESCKQIV
jgi:hypothetical protein